MPSATLKVLIVDDEKSTRLVLRAFLASHGYDVVEAGNGQEGVEVFARERPDIVIMDVIMPVMNGYEAVPIIKKMSGANFVPVIFLTALNDNTTLAKCVESGGDDFVTKPFNSTILMAKLHATERTLRLYNELYEFQQTTEAELRLARHVFATITQRMRKPIPGLGYWTQPAGHLPGDMVLYDTTPSGQIYAMVADFTGHGFSAAVGAIPVADIFFALTRKDFALVDIAAEVNRKLRQIFPVGHFCAASFVASNPATWQVKVINAGLPDVLLVSHERKVVQKFPSRNLPLGIANLKAGDVVQETAQHMLGSKLVVYTDGLTEAMNAKETALGEAGLLETIRTSAGQPLFETIQQSVVKHTSGMKPHDDISLLVLPIEFPHEAPDKGRRPLAGEQSAR